MFSNLFRRKRNKIAKYSGANGPERSGWNCAPMKCHMRDQGREIHAMLQAPTVFFRHWRRVAMHEIDMRARLYTIQQRMRVTTFLPGQFVPAHMRHGEAAELIKGPNSAGITKAEKRRILL